MKEIWWSTLVLIWQLSTTAAHDQPQWGEKWSRNMVSSETGLPDSFDPKSAKNVRWVVNLGTETHSTPIVAGGRVYIGTNNGEPRDPRHQGDRGVLMCFDETDGHLLWQLVVPKREEDPYHDWPKTGISSPVTVEENHVYLVSNRGEVMCLDTEGLANGNDGPYQDEGRHMSPKGEPPMTPGPLDADILWLFDMTAGAGIWSHDAAHTSIVIDGDFLYLNSGTGVDNTHVKIRTPNAPSLLVVDKKTGRLLARDDEHMAPNIFHCTWSSPSIATIGGKRVILFGGGNGILYGFEPIRKAPSSGEVMKLRKLWQFDFDPSAPKENVHRYNKNRREGPSNFYGMPVFDHDRIYLAGGGDLFWGKNEAWLKCLDVLKSSNGAPAEAWSTVMEKHVLSTPAIVGGLVFIADCGRRFHCLDAANGKTVWTQDIAGEVWGSPMVADGKVYLGTRSGQFWILAASKEKRVLSSIELRDPISATVTPANGAIYVATMRHLYKLQTNGN